MSDAELHKYAEGYFLGSMLIRDTIHEIPREDIPRLKSIMKEGALATVSKLCTAIDSTLAQSQNAQNQKSPF